MYIEEGLVGTESHSKSVPGSSTMRRFMELSMMMSRLPHPAAR